MSRGRKRVAFVGGTEVGKSTQIALMLEHPRVKAEAIIIYDENRQKKWIHLPEITMDQWRGMISGFYRITDPDYEMFYEILSEKYKRGWKGTVVHEDAGVALGAQKNPKLFKNIIGLRHKETDLVKVFHALKEVPPYIMRQLNDLILFKTGDNWKDVADRFPDDKVEEVRKAFEFVNSSPNRHIFKRITLRATGTI